MTQSETPSTAYRHNEAEFVKTWRNLQAGRFIAKTELIDGTDYQLWRYNLRDLTDRQLGAGVTASGHFHGYLTWAAFRKLCMEQSLTEQEQRRQSYKPTTARLDRPCTLGNARFQELNKVTQAMSEEAGEGPITKTTKAGKLNKHFVRGKSAQEIIDQCKKLYG